MNHTTLLLPREKNQNKILNIQNTIVRLKWYSGASSHIMREEDQHGLVNIVNTPGPMIIMPDAGHHRQAIMVP